MKKTLLILAFAFALLAGRGVGVALSADDDLSMRHIRNATIKLSSGDSTFLIDPMFAEVGAYEGFPNTYRSWLRNPLTPLPMPPAEILKDVDAVILTHTHLDHWDPAAWNAIPKDTPIYTQNEEDAEAVRKQGFSNVKIMKQSDEIGGVKIDRTRTRHGSEAMYANPETAKLLGEVMGLVFTTPGGKKAWLVGDTVWFDGVDEALEKHSPDVIIVNAGGAALTAEQFKDSPEIIMKKEDVRKMVERMPDADVVAIHMDAINHMTVDRKDLSEYLRENGIREKVIIPFDGEKINF